MARRAYLDAAKGWGMLMVMFGHISPLSTPVDRYFSSYKVALFFVVSGYATALAGSLSRYEFSSYAKKHFRSLMLPYLGVSLLLLPYTAWVDYRGGRSLLEIRERLLGMAFKTISLRGYSSLWFLPCLFLAQLLFFWVMKKGKLWQGVLLLLSLLAGLFTDPFNQYLTNALGDKGKFLTFPLLALGKSLFGCFFLLAGFGAYSLGENRKERGGKEEETESREGERQEEKQKQKQKKEEKQLEKQEEEQLEEQKQKEKQEEKQEEKQRGWIGIGLSVLCLGLCFYLRVPGMDYNGMNFKGVYPLALLLGVTGSLGCIWTFGAYGRGLFFSLCAWAGRHSLFLLVTHVAFNIKYLAYLGYDALFTVPKEAGLTYYLDICFVLALTLFIEAGMIAALGAIRERGIYGTRKKGTEKA